MSEELQKYKQETFAVDAHEYLYEISIDGNNSLLKIFNSEAKLRTTQRMKLPANCLVYPCEHFLVLVGPTEISLFHIPNVSTRISCPNPGIQRISLLCFNRASNLIFLLTE